MIAATAVADFQRQRQTEQRFQYGVARRRQCAGVNVDMDNVEAGDGVETASSRIGFQRADAGVDAKARPVEAARKGFDRGQVGRQQVMRAALPFYVGRLHI